MPTPMMTLAPASPLTERLHALYHDASKHSVYQSVPAFMARALGYQEEIHSLWRSDTPRYRFIADRLKLSPGDHVVDIGANTGFFSLNLAHDHPDIRLTAFEMNPRHAEYIGLAAERFGLDRLQVRSQSCDLAGLSALPECDTVFLLNVLHHAGFDFDGHVADNNAAFTRHAGDYLTRLRGCAGQLVFQIGSNRGGDKTRPVHPRDDDRARLAWTAGLLHDAGWKIEQLGYAQLDEAGAVVFRDVPPAVLAAARANATEIEEVAEFLSDADLARFPGEFHRRPLVIATAATQPF